MRCRDYDTLCEWDDEDDDEVMQVARKWSTLSLEDAAQAEARHRMAFQRQLRDSMQQTSSAGPGNAAYEALVARIEQLEAKLESETAYRHRMIRVLSGSDPAADAPVVQGPSKRRRPAA